MEELVSLLKSAKHCVFLTGAGISTLSGIPDFRGKDGLYNRFDPDLIFSLDHFYKDPSYFYTHGKELIYNVEEKQPNIVHRVLAHLEEAGIVRSVITQNIDMLHQRAGSVNVIEVHGSPRTHHCLSCGKVFPFLSIAQMLRKMDVPVCDECGGLIKPDIIFYGECLDRDSLDRAISECTRADLIVVLGSSLVVQPAASLPLYTLENDGVLLIVNDMDTPLDHFARAKWGDLYKVFEYLGGRFNILDV